MNRTATATIAKNSLWLTISFLFSKSSQFIAQIFLARLLSPEDFGVWGMVQVITVLTSLFRDTATASVLVQRGLEDKKLVDAVYSLGISISVIMFFVQMLIGFPLARFFDVALVWPLTVCVAFVFLIGAGSGAHAAVLQRQMKFRALAVSDSIAGFARFASAVICASLGAGVWSFAIAEIVSTLVDSVLKRWLSHYRFTYRLIPDASAVQDVKGYISSLVGINLAVYLNTNGDNFLVGKLLGVRSLGFYSLAYQLAMLPTFALSQINRINFSVLSHLDNRERKSYLYRMLELYALSYALIYGIGFVIAPWIIPFMYGMEWAEIVILFQIILVFAYTRGFMAILGTTLNAMNYPQVNAAINWALVPLSIPTFAVGAWLGGVKGVAISVALVMGVGATVWFWIAICYVAKWNLRELIQPVLLPTVAMAIAISLTIATKAFNLAPLLQNFLEPLLLIVVYVVILSVASNGKIPRMLLDLVKRAMVKESAS